MYGGTIFGQDFFGQGPFLEDIPTTVAAGSADAAAGTLTITAPVTPPSGPGEGGIGTGGGGGWSGPGTHDWIDRWTTKVEAAGATAVEGRLGVVRRIVVPRLKRRAKVRAGSATQTYGALHITPRHTVVVGVDDEPLEARGKLRVFAPTHSRSVDGRVYSEVGVSTWEQEESQVLAMAFSLMDE